MSGPAVSKPARRSTFLPFPLFVLGPALLFVPNVAYAHHPKFKQAFRLAIKHGNLNALRPLFTNAAWEGRDGSLAGRELHGLFKKSKRKWTYLTLGGPISRKSVVMSLQLSVPGEDHPRLYLFLAIPALHLPKANRPSLVVKIAGKEIRSGWGVTRVTRDFAAARKFIGHSLSYIVPKAPKLVGETAGWGVPVAERLNHRQDIARSYSLPASWARNDPESPSRVHEELRKRSVLVIPHETRGKGDRIWVRLWLWNLEKGAFEPDRYALMTHGKDVKEWLLDAVTRSAEEASAYLKSGLPRIVR